MQEGATVKGKQEGNKVKGYRRKKTAKPRPYPI